MKQSTVLGPENFVREWYKRGVRGGDLDFLFECMSEQIQWWCFGPPGFRTNGYYEGKSEVQKFFLNLSQTLDVNMAENFVPAEFHVAGDVVFVFGRERGVVKQPGHAQTGLKFDNYFAHTLYLAGGKIRRFRVNYTVIPQDSLKVAP